MPPTPTETQRAWDLVLAIVANDKLGPPRNDVDEQWEKVFNRALEVSVLYTVTAANFPP